MEIRLRYVFIVIAVMALLFAAFRIIPRGSVTPANTPTPTTESESVDQNPPSTAAQARQVRIVNESHWTVEGAEQCIPRLNAWLDENFAHLKTLDIAIVDALTPEMSVGLVYEETEVKGVCRDAGVRALECSMTVADGDVPSLKVDAVMSGALGLFVADYYRPLSKEEWENPSVIWTFDKLQPLVKKEGDQWQSNCLRVSP